MIKMNDLKNIATRAPKGGATSPLNGERYKGGQFMCCQFDMPKGYKSIIKKIVAKTAAKNIASLTVRASLSGSFCVDKVEAGSDCVEIVFTGTKNQANEFVTVLKNEKDAASIKAGFYPHPTEIFLYN